MTVTGPYHKIAEFLSNVGSLTRIVAPMNVSLRPSNRGGVKVGPREQRMDASFEVQTFVAKMGAAPATPLATPGGP
jgi:Tfp pilus assembly protein PilO